MGTQAQFAHGHASCGPAAYSGPEAHPFKKKKDQRPSPKELKKPAILSCIPVSSVCCLHRSRSQVSRPATSDLEGHGSPAAGRPGTWQHAISILVSTSPLCPLRSPRPRAPPGPAGRPARSDATLRHTHEHHSSPPLALFFSLPISNPSSSLRAAVPAPRSSPPVAAEMEWRNHGIRLRHCSAQPQV